jgi:hypothetical protein
MVEAVQSKSTTYTAAWRIRAMLEAMRWAKAAGVPFSRYRAVKPL